ncbi:uncharacterized protein VTP21DRAFT_11545 [Calcarisporiella thermophila]|uniref:uncharacterized protein n=1 Tax=Calcarisporiella thermophila TaxID=911321 RepID=UPI00374484CC
MPDEKDTNSGASIIIKRPKVNLAPDVDIQDQPSFQSNQPIKEIAYNAPYEHLYQNPELHTIKKNVLTGHVEEQAFSEMEFKIQQRNFVTLGYARDPSIISQNYDGTLGAGINGTGHVGDINQGVRHGWASYYNSLPKELRKNQNMKRKSKGDSSVLEGENAYQGPWAGYEGETVAEAEPTEEELAAQAEAEAEAETTVDEGKKSKEMDIGGGERSIFHGKEMYDYQGRTYMHVPQDVDVNLLGEPGEQECFLPKKHIHTWTGHTKAVSAIRFFPESAHLLLSCSMDTKVKLWDVYHERRCLRTFLGHSKAVRDITFTNDGRKFLSASYDRYIKLWDTETGQCIRSFTTRKIPYCVKFNPDEDKQNIFLAGMSDKKIVQFDVNTGEITQEYDQHLGAVNTITFVDDNRRFVTTSDDKTLRAWEFDIPVVIKYIAEPDMHSMPSVSLHPNKKWLACQSLDNQILIYGAKDRFRMHRKKRFTGHLVAGYACQVNFSPDGRFLMSGDSSGQLWFWDWKSCRVLKKMKCHNQVLIGCEWHPHETSKVATCSWDGTIKYWD